MIILRYYVDWLWFGEVGLRTVFWTRIVAGVVVGVSFAVVFFALVYGNIEIACRFAPKYRPVRGVDFTELMQPTAVRRVRLLGLAVSLIGAVIVGFVTAGSWLIFVRALHSVPFGVQDPIFHHDLSFYVFSLPAWRYVYGFVFATLIVALILAILARVALGGILTQPTEASDSSTPSGRPTLGREIRRALELVGAHIDKGAAAHVSALLGAIFVLAGAGYLFKAWNLLYSTAGVFFGAGYTDAHVRLPLIRVLMGLALLLGVALIYNAVRGRRLLWPPIAIGAWIVALIVLLGIVPAAWQGIAVSPNQLAKETPYIANNIAATRSAYNLTSISETPYSLQGDLSAATLQDNKVTVSNIRLWDPEVLLPSYSQLQELRPYYSFTSVSVDRYLVNNVYTQTMLAPRELLVSGLPSEAQTWVNQHITYTHGYGVTVSAVNQVASGGSPDFLVQNVPLVSSASSLAITQPRIYYGLTGTNYVFVKTKNQEFDYPGPNGDVYTGYTGAGGFPVDSFLKRLALTFDFGGISFFTSSAITNETRVILRDNIKTRLAAAAPFLQFDNDPYMVVADGKLYWIADAYTTTNLVPYSEPDGTLNYIRNSVKVVIDAYNGTMDFYVFDPSDPLIQVYEKIYPGMFKPASAHARDPATARALSGRLLRHASADVRHLPRDRSQSPVQQGQPVGAAEQPRDLRFGADEPLLHDHAAAGSDSRRVRPHRAVRAQRPQQHDRVAGRGVRHAQLRQGGELRVPVQSQRVRPGAGGSRHQPRPHHLVPAHPVGPAGVDRDLRQPADGAHRQLVALRATALSAVFADQASADPAHHRLLSLAVGQPQLAVRPAAERGDGSHDR